MVIERLVSSRGEYTLPRINGTPAHGRGRQVFQTPFPRNTTLQYSRSGRCLADALLLYIVVVYIFAGSRGVKWSGVVL